MTRCKILLADLDLSYLAPLELALLREYDEQLDISLVTDAEYLREMFSRPQRLDVVVINESLWQPEFRRHDIGQILLLSEEHAESGARYEYPQIYKYTSVQNVVQRLDGVLQRYLRAGETTECRQITVYSPQGGSGKTTIALGLAASLAGLGSRVIYIDAEPLQDFCAIIGEQNGMDQALLREMKQGRVEKQTLMQNLSPGSFACLLPMRHSLASCGLREESYGAIFRTIREEHLFDFIVVDTSSSFDEDKIRLLTGSDYVVVPLLQNAGGARKLEALHWNLELTDEEKFVFVCNAFRESDPNQLLQVGGGLRVSETIAFQQPAVLESVNAMRQSGVYMGLAYRFL